ncbi:hypothetical protein DFH08DRAFT_934239 [Mycena albidolilacea]|uniref:Uncharacterized protein n=1 Tax=Mycena albidolilacea TaxID=1033008 RepID=A0AAD7EUT0_9AGAR|nr:hypothetical protein DFH08DRAFT_934239 [Mycena albidolilacea]
MAGDETLQKDHEDSGSEDEEEDVIPRPRLIHPRSRRCPDSPEVISKQATINLGIILSRNRAGFSHDQFPFNPFYDGKHTLLILVPIPCLRLNRVTWLRVLLPSPLSNQLDSI